jgi:hypothetical protein
LGTHRGGGRERIEVRVGGRGCIIRLCKQLGDYNSQACSLEILKCFKQCTNVTKYILDSLKTGLEFSRTYCIDRMGVYPLGNVPKEINNRFGRYS